jgi:hypothetical protein
MKNKFFIAMFYLGLPWMFLASYIYSFYKRVFKKEYHEYDYEAMSGYFNWLMPIGAGLTLYILITLLIKVLIKIITTLLLII